MRPRRPLSPLLLAGALALGLFLLPSVAAKPVPAPPGGVPYPESEAEYRSPVGGSAPVIQGNGGSFSHTGRLQHSWDYGVAEGSTIVAARSGVVVKARSNSAVGDANRRFATHGNHVLVDHLDGTGGTYYHCRPDGVRVQVGDWVMQGEAIAESGDTGWSGRPHLHFGVVDLPSEKTVPSRFADFKSNGGIPKEGHTVQAARPPAVPQETIDRYRRAARAAVTAAAQGCAPLAWRYAGSIPSRRRKHDYYYDRVLERGGARQRTRVMERIARLETTQEPGAEDLGFAHVARLVLAKAKDPEMKRARTRLDAAVKAWPKETTAPWRAETAALKAWVAGLEGECEEDGPKARDGYAKAKARARGVFREPAAASLARVVGRWEGRLDARITRRQLEVKIVTKPLQKAWIADDLARLRAEAKRVRTFVTNHGPGAKAEAKAAYDARVARLKDAARRLDAR